MTYPRPATLHSLRLLRPLWVRITRHIWSTFGISILEKVVVILAKGAGNYAERQYRLLGEILYDHEEITFLTFANIVL